MSESIMIDQNKRLTVLPRGGKRFSKGLEQISRSDQAALIACKARWPEEDTDAVEWVLSEMEHHPEIKQFIASETIDHFELPGCAALYALPGSESEPEFHRFGGDGLFHKSLIGKYSQYNKLITLHLCARPTLVASTNDGGIVDLVEGYSALSGLPGLTTCGEIDPSLIFYLLENGYSVHEVRDLLYHQSGWSSFTQSPLTFHQLMTGQDPQLDIPRSIYFQGVVKGIGAMLAALGGADLILCGCDSVGEVVSMYDQICCHFQNNALKFELIELNRDKVIQDQIDQIIDASSKR